MYRSIAPAGLIDPWPGFQGRDIFRHSVSQKTTWYRAIFTIERKIGSHMRSIEWWHFQWPWRTLTRFARSQHISSRISQVSGLRDKVTIERLQETIPSLSNATTFNDLDWLLIGMRRFSDIRLQKYRDLENRVKGPSMSLEISPFDWARTTSYWRSIVTMALSPVVSEIFSVEKCHDLEIGVKGHSSSLKVVPLDRLCIVSY